MRYDQYMPASNEMWHENFVPKRHHSQHDIFQTFRCRQQRRIDVCISRVVGGMFRA